MKLRWISTVPAPLVKRLEEKLGAPFTIVFGQTECYLVIGSNSNLFPIRPGSMGKATPGFDVRIVNDKGKELPRGAQPAAAVAGRLIELQGGELQERPRPGCSCAVVLPAAS